MERCYSIFTAAAAAAAVIWCTLMSTAASCYSNYTTILVLHSFNGLFSRTTWVNRYQKGTRSSAIANGPRDASCQLKSCQLPRNSDSVYINGTLIVSWRATQHYANPRITASNFMCAR